jgi:hypothetical protein
MSELIRRPAPKMNESCASYIYRLTNANFLPSLSYIAYELSATVPKLKNSELNQNQVGLLANLTRQNPKSLERMTLNHWSKEFDSYSDKIVIKNKVKFCPACIQEENNHQVQWLFYPLNICLKHSIKLTDQCDACGEKIFLESLMEGFCLNCQHKFNKSNCVHIDNKTIFYHSQLYLGDRLFGTQPDGDWFIQLSLRDYIELAFCSLSLIQSIPSYVDPSKTIKAFHNKRDTVKDSSNIADAFADVYWMYQDFPKCFFKVLDDFQLHKQFQLRYMQKAQFELLFENKQFNHLKRSYEQYWIEQLDQGKVRRDLSVFRKNPSLLDKSLHVGIEEVRGAYGLSPQTVHRLSAKQPIFHSKTVKGGYTRYLIPKENLVKAAQEHRSYITKGEVAQILGIQKDSVPKLINAGIIKCYKTAYADNDLHSFQEIQHLLDRCRGKYVYKELQGIPFHDALIKYSINGITIVKVIEYTHRKILNPISPIREGSLEDNYYSLSDLEECMHHLKEERKAAKGYTLTEVMKIIKIGEKKMWRIVNEGALVPDHIDIMKDGRKRYFFQKEKVQQYINKLN